MVDLGQASSGAGECRRSFKRTDHYRWSLLADMFEKRVRLYPRSHIEVFAMLRNVRVVHEPSQARMNGKRVPVTPTMCASTSLLMSRLLCARRATQDACNSPSKKTSSNKRRPPAGMALPIHETCTEHKYVMPSCAKPQERTA